MAAQMVKNLPAVQETQFRSLGREFIPWRRKWLPTPGFLPREFHGQRSLEVYSPRDHKELDTTEWLTYILPVLGGISKEEGRQADMGAQGAVGQHVASAEMAPPGEAMSSQSLEAFSSR